MKKDATKATGFNLLVPFTINKDAGTEDLETIKISGIANFCGDLEDDKCIEVDLAGEVVVPSGMDISVYKGNPQILWQHDRDYSVGTCDKITKKKDGIYIDATIHKGAMEEEDWYRVKNGLVTRFSVGFRCKGGEFKEINGRSVYFITKSLLLEISIVTIPASSSSSFSVVKSLGDEEDGLYAGDIYKYSDEEDTEVQTKTDNEEESTTMKLKLKDILSASTVEEFKSKGMEAALEVEQEMSQKDYIDSIVEAKFAALKEEIIKELSATEEATPAAAAEGTEEPAAAAVEDTPAVEDAPAGEEAPAEISEEEKAADAERVKELTETINQLRILVEETK